LTLPVAVSVAITK